MQAVAMNESGGRSQGLAASRLTLESTVPSSIIRTLAIPESRWQRYNRGLEKLLIGFLMIMACNVIFQLLALPRLLVDDSQWQPFFVGVALVGIIVLGPLAVADFGESLERRSALAQIEPSVDQTLEELGVEWNGHYLVKVYDLLTQGRSDEARRLLQKESESTWDATDKLLRDWRMTVLLAKVDAIRRHAQRTNPITDDPIETRNGR
jgi:hypothetical protein